jgi:hypothetical protein
VGIYGGPSGSTAKVVGSTFADNAIGMTSQSGYGANVSFSVFRHNGTGIFVGDGTLIARHNTFTDNGTAMHTYFTGVTVTDNRITGGDIALNVEANEQWGADIHGNTVTGARVGISFVSGFINPPWGIVADLTGNVFRSNREVGLVASGPARVTGNLFLRNGFAPASPTAVVGGARLDHAVVTGNRAIRNAGYGITASDSTDGGGNIARANGNPGQCLGVVCG